MQIIEIKTLENGAHRNQIGDFEIIPEGYAVIPDNMDTPNFPFGQITTKKIGGIVTVTKWVAGTMPDVEEEKPSISEIEQLRADIDYLAVMTGVEL